LFWAFSKSEYVHEDAARDMKKSDDNLVAGSAIPSGKARGEKHSFCSTQTYQVNNAQRHKNNWNTFCANSASQHL
jgi:hypothetical protein